MNVSYYATLFIHVYDHSISDLERTCLRIIKLIHIWYDWVVYVQRYRSVNCGKPTYIRKFVTLILFTSAANEPYNRFNIISNFINDY